ncbi:RNA-directed DNA polymerase, eukaryota [Tanacetum coccineum]
MLVTSGFASVCFRLVLPRSTSDIVWLVWSVYIWESLVCMNMLSEYALRLPLCLSESVAPLSAICCTCLIYSRSSPYLCDSVLCTCKWVSNDKNILIILVYAPQELSEKKMLWQYLNHVINSWSGEVVVMGDFNEVRSQDECYGFVFNAQGAAAFNLFISVGGLVEVSSGGYSFTWSHKSTSKMSKLDHFLIFEGLMDSCSNISAITLDRFLSDHRPILLRELSFDYGPTPFWFFHYWFELEGFDKRVEEIWSEPLTTEPNDMLRLLKKLKRLKVKIRTWVKDNKDRSQNHRKSFKGKLAEIDTILDKGGVKSDFLEERMNTMKKIQDLDKTESLEAAQKAKIRWLIEGDENTKYFHDIINKQRSKLSIRGILADGVWIDDPNDVVFLGQWCGSNITTIVHVLECFSMRLWVWRIRTQSNSLWARVIKAIHGEDGKFNNLPKSICSSTWLDIVHDTTKLNRQGIDLFGFIKKKVGNGEETSFWDDFWMGEASLKSLYLRVYALESCKNISVASKMAHANMGFLLRRIPRGGAESDQFSALSSIVEGINLPIIQDRWIWSLDGSGR